MQLLCLYGPRKSIAKNELSKQQLTVTLSDCNHLAHVIVLWQIHKFMCHCAVFALYLSAISKYQPPGAYIWRGDLIQFFLRYKFGGLIDGAAYFRSSTVYPRKSA